MSEQPGAVTERRITGRQPEGDVKERLTTVRQRQPAVRQPHIDVRALEAVVKALDWSIGPPGVNAA